MAVDLAGHLLDLGVSVSDLPEGALIADAIVIVKYVDADGSVGLRAAFGPGSSWIERIGMLRVTLTSEESDIAAGSTDG